MTLITLGTGKTIITVNAEPSVSITVNSTLDAVDANLSDSVCETAPGNLVCTLRAAIQTANALPGSDTILLPSGTYTLTIEGTAEDYALTGDLDIRDDLTIQGAGPATTIIDGNNLDRVFNLPVAKTVVISGLTIQNGANVSSGAGIFNNGGNLTLSNIVIKENDSDQLNGNGGGLDSYAGVVMITESEIYNNYAQSNGGGIFNNDGMMQIQNSAIFSNTTTSYHGGGIGSTGTLAVDQTTIANNTAGLEGGGIYARGPLTLTNSTISGNYAPNIGGGLFITNTLSLENSTISGNSAGLYGGGIYNTVTSTLASATIIQNSAAFGGNIYNNGLFSIKNSLIDASLSGNNCFGTITSLGYNISSDGSCALSGTGDQNSVDPLLGPLQDNGGSTFTHALPYTSPAIDSGNPAGCTDVLGNLLEFDQRGLFRHVDSDGNGSEICDVGAYEYSAVDLSISKTDNHTTAVPGATTTYTITLSNAGPGKINNAILSDPLTPQMSDHNWTCIANPGSNCDEISGNGEINFGVDLADDGIVTVIVTTTISPAATGWLTNTATITPPFGAIETVTANNTATDIDVLAPLADLEITQSVTPSLVHVGELFTYQLNIYNAGPSQSTSIVVSDTLPTAVVFNNAAGTGWMCNKTGYQVDCSRPALSVGVNPPINIQVYAPTVTGTITNTAGIASLAIDDDNWANNSSQKALNVILYHSILPIIIK